MYSDIEREKRYLGFYQRHILGRLLEMFNDLP